MKKLEVSISANVDGRTKMKARVSVKSMLFDQKVILGLSIPLVALLILCSSVGLMYPEIYSASSPNWLTQTVVQDGVNLFIVTPILIVAALYSFQGVKFAFLMWGGTVGYLVYTFLIYCFSVHFNFLFLAYCLVLGLSVFSLGWFFLTQVRNPVVTGLNDKRFSTVMGIYFIGIALVFYTMWLWEIVPAIISQTVPGSLAEIGLMTNPVHVIDLSLFLPFVFITGVITINRRPLATILVPTILIFFILMDMTIVALTVALLQQGFGGFPVVAIAMIALGLFSLASLIWFVRIVKEDLTTY